MLILAVDSATPVAGVALLKDNKLLYEELTNYKKTHSETLMPMIDRALATCECTLQDLTAIAVTEGPGSFTGLRIGMGTVKGLSLAAGIPVAVVSTLDVLAANVAGSNLLVGTILDARKNEVYAAFYDSSSTMPQRLTPMQPCSPEQLVMLAQEQMKLKSVRELVLLGDGFYPYEAYFRESLGLALKEAGPQQMLPRAASLASLAVKKVQEKEYVDPLSLRPLYIRLSEAEYRLGRGEL